MKTSDDIYQSLFLGSRGAGRSVLTWLALRAESLVCVSACATMLLIGDLENKRGRVAFR